MVKPFFFNPARKPREDTVFPASALEDQGWRHNKMAAESVIDGRTPSGTEHNHVDAGRPTPPSGR
jgi:hypothetical protein